MSLSGREHLEAIFLEAADLPTSDRGAFLDRACAGDAALRGEVEALLAADDHAPQSFLAGTPTSPTLPDGPREMPARFGPYRVIRLVGEGGMGSVYEAEQENPRRIVALKVIRAGLASREIVRRFQHEAHVLGQFRHPGIAQVYEAGSRNTPEREAAGLPPIFFLAMEFVRGKALDKFARARGLDVRAMLALMGAVADAAHHAHDKGVVHRDLKPGNIFVDESGQPKILDFGVARATDSDLRTMTLQTSAGQLIGTLPYMSPEQVEGDPRAIDARSDVYALGVLTYELLAGRLPLDVHNRPIPEAARIIRESEPGRLSSVNTAFRGDVETIVAKAMDKDRARRYASAADFAADLRRYLRDEPIAARPAGAGYQLRKFVRRNKAIAIGAAAVLVVLAGASVVSAYWAVQADRQRAAAVTAAANARKNEVAAQRLAYRATLSAAASFLQARSGGGAVRRLDDVPAELRGWEWSVLRHAADMSLEQIGLGVGLRGVQISDDQSRLAVWQFGTILVLDARTKERLCVIDAPDAWPRMSPTGTRVLAVAPSMVTMYDVPSGRPLWTTAGPVTTTAFPFVRDTGEVVLHRRSQQRAEILNADTGDVVRSLELPAASIYMVDAVGDHCLMLHGDNDPARVVDLRTNSTLAIARWSGGLLSENLRTYAGPGGQRFFIDDLGTNRRSYDEVCPLGTYVSLAVSADGRLVSKSEPGGDITLIDAASGQPVSRLTGHQSNVVWMTISRDGTRLYSSSTDGTLRVWSTMSSLMPAVTGISNEGLAVGCVSPDGRLVCATGWGSLRAWDARTGRELWSAHLSRRDMAGYCAVDGDSQRVVVTGYGHETWVLSARDGSVIAKWSGMPSRGVAAAWSGPDAVVACENGSLWKLAVPATGGTVGTDRLAFADADDPARRLVAPSAGRSVLAIAGSRACRIVDVGTGATVRVIPGSATMVAFSPDGSRFAAGFDSGRLVLGDSRGDAPLTELSERGVMVVAGCLSPDGSRLVIARLDGQPQVYDTRVGDELVSLPLSAGSLHTLGFSPDGSALMGMGDRLALVRYESTADESVLRERRTVALARQLFEPLWTRTALASEVHALVDERAGASIVSDEVRAMAHAIVSVRGDQPNQINSEAWGLVRFADAAPDKIRTGLALSRRASEMLRDDPTVLNTYGVALYRAGEPGRALEVLRRSDRLVRGAGRFPKGHPGDWFFIAMSAHKCGLASDARSALAYGRELLLDPEFATDPECQAFQTEAARLIEGESAAPASGSGG